MSGTLLSRTEVDAALELLTESLGRGDARNIRVERQADEVLPRLVFELEIDGTIRKITIPEDLIADFCASVVPILRRPKSRRKGVRGRVSDFLISMVSEAELAARRHPDESEIML